MFVYILKSVVSAVAAAQFIELKCASALLYIVPHTPPVFSSSLLFFSVHFPERAEPRRVCVASLFQRLQTIGPGLVFFFFFFSVT